ncbi:hypothetical protein OEK97_28545, partial [Escherichia coli]|uniref:hypothetical protein n=1 Tax=Escherichia coli TaxID=562 RepID=UPI0021DB326E
ALADKAASMAPNLFQMQQGMGTLQNRDMMNLLAMGKDTGLFKNLGDIFKSVPVDRSTWVPNQNTDLPQYFGLGGGPY